MIVRELNFDSDFKDISTWWEQQGCPVPSVDYLGTGFIVEDGAEKLACVFIYTTQSSIFIMEGLVGNPGSDKSKRSDAIAQLIGETCDWCKSYGAETVIATVGKSRIMDNLVKNNFQKVEENLTTFARSL